MNSQSPSFLKRLAAIIFLIAIACLVALPIRRQIRHVSRVATPAAPRELSRTNLVIEEGRWRQPGSSMAFTGFMVEHYADGVLRSRSAVTDGLLHGLSEGWYTNAQIQVSEQFRNGVSHGLRTKWYPGGAKQSEANITDGKLNGAFRRWHENGILAEQVEFVAGEPEGTAISYFPSGFLKARVVLKDAKPVQQEFWKDGENKG